MIEGLLAILGGYLVGSIPVAIWFCRWRHGFEISEKGSRNPGATNVFRVLGWKSGLFVFCGDVAKGALPTGIALLFFPDPHWFVVLAGFGAFLGHLYPFLASFKGGKGVATATGTLLFLVPIPLAVAVLVYAAILFAFKKGSLASLASSLCFLPLVWVFSNQMYFGYSLVLVVFIFFTHRANLHRLLSGKEIGVFSEKTD